LNSPTRRAVLRGRRSYADGGPTRTAVLRGRRSYADGGPARTAVLRGRRSCADGGPMRTAVLRGRRQRDSSLWTPFHRCGGELVRLKPFIRTASPRQKEGGTKWHKTAIIENGKDTN